MDKTHDTQRQPYSWHQSHDQATVLLLVPSETSKEDVLVVIERDYLLAGVRGQQPVVKGRLYGRVDVANSAWQLEPRTSRPSARERTTSTVSTTSTQSSYALVSDPEISSSFAASLESGQTSDAEEVVLTASSPGLSSPVSSGDERLAYPRQSGVSMGIGVGVGAGIGVGTDASATVSPAMQPHALSSFSSLESLASPSGRLLTLHLEKEQSIIWPSLVVGPVPKELSPCAPVPAVLDTDPGGKYNMDPTSLVLFAIELLDIRKDREEAFECFVRAWHQAHLPSATMKLVTYYMPLQMPLNVIDIDEEKQRGTMSYCLQCIGGPHGLAQLFLEAGLLHLEGAASVLLSASYSTLSSIRVPLPPQPGEGGAEAWKRDREMASRYFDRARTLYPELDVPAIAEGMGVGDDGHELEMPSIEIHSSAPESVYSVEDGQEKTIRRRRTQQPQQHQSKKKKEEELIFLDDVKGREDIDNAWYLYLPSLVGAGTALLVVGVIGALSFSSWRRNQGS